jgi:hypothetical protein
MLAATHSELLLGDHHVITALHDTLNSKLTTYNCSSVYQRYQPLYLPHIIFLPLCFEVFFKFKGQNRKNIVLYSFYKPFCRTCLLHSTRRYAPRALKNASDKMVSYKTRRYNKLLFPLCTSGRC